MCGVPGNKKTETLTEQAKRLSAELYQNNCNDLSRCYTDYNHKMGARPKDPALGNQRVLETTKAGLSIALRRGLNLLVYDYKTEILRRDKELSRTQSESVPATSEDVDLERKYEHLPLSELITADTSVGIKSFTDEVFVSKTWSTVVKASELVQRALENGSKRCSALTPHLECLGAVLLLLEKNGLLGTPVTECVIVRQRAKKSADGYEAIRLLMVLSTTAWVEMLERWYAMPEASTVHLPMVCNLNSLELRCLGKLVQEEHKYSTTLLLERCCAMVIAETPQALRRRQYDLLEMAAGE